MPLGFFQWFYLFKLIASSSKTGSAPSPPQENSVTTRGSKNTYFTIFMRYIFQLSESNIIYFKPIQLYYNHSTHYTHYLVQLAVYQHLVLKLSFAQ